MILNIWKPKTKSFNGKQRVIYYELVDDPKLINSNTRVTWICDNKNCKTPNLIHSISASHLDPKKSKHNTLDKQICHSCQMSGENNPMYGNNKTLRELMGDDDRYDKLIRKYSERSRGKNNMSHREDIKLKKGQFIINQENLTKLLENNNEQLLSYSGDNKNCLLEIKCINGHVRKQRYHSYKNGKGCIECFWDEISISLEEKNDYKRYRKLVYHYTRKSIRKNKLKKYCGSEYHLDHKFSISKGFKLGVLPEIIGFIGNLEYIPAIDNLKKLDKCSISLEELMESYDIYYKKK